ncbi:DNA cytosine methyltransferase [Pseudanabaena sp. 'Roaring Creek']|uniref:DNA cytosine methyltransferase n=1 Tax=Pseudanabaena sp. 'Roaring Creek' TaxID=1681830 RepID=UPI0006D77B9F|nr:DNA cytosine methyltransferase [Pseudanabaena sp. 'Roaring Creek']
MLKTFATAFTGFDLFGIGAIQAGYKGVFGIDIHQPAVDFCHRNGAEYVVCGDVRSYDYSRIETGHSQFSPECKSFSYANVEGKESDLDRQFARAIVRSIAETKSETVSIENVAGYAREDCESFHQIILPFLAEDYYYWYSVYCAADFGVPQVRKRLILRAIRKSSGRYLKPLVPTHSRNPDSGLLPWVSWYDAIEEAGIIPSLKPIKLTNWQRASLIEQGFDIDGQTCLISKDGSRRKKGYENLFAVIIPKDSPTPTIKALGHDGHSQQYTIVINGEAFRISTAALAVWQTVPLDLEYADKDDVNCMGIGNGVPCLFAQKIMESFAP